MQALAGRRGGGGNNDSISTALQPQLCNRHSIKTHSRNTDRKQIELTGQHTTLYQTNTLKNAHTYIRKIPLQTLQIAGIFQRHTKYFGLKQKFEGWEPL